jgi:hypothetical protein
VSLRVEVRRNDCVVLVADSEHSAMNDKEVMEHAMRAALMTIGSLDHPKVDLIITAGDRELRLAGYVSDK